MNIIFIKGAKQSVVDFINRGLKGCKSKVRISANLSGEQIADRLNGHDCSIDMNSYLPIPATFLHYDTTNGPLSFCEWYALGCLDYSDNFDKDMYHTRWQEINDYLKAHPERFTADEDEEYSAADLDKALKEIHPELFDAYRKYIHRYYCAASYQKRKYGVIGWEEWGLKYYGCPESVPLDLWKLKCETKEELCLSFQLIDPLDYPISFLKYLNSINGVTVYAYGFDYETYLSWFQYNGLKDELVINDVSEDPRFEVYKAAYGKQPDYNPKIADSEASYKVLEGYVQNFLKELNSFFNCL
jgi:hypothetical protein